jgi:histidyl-tRNA synthetase
MEALILTNDLMERLGLREYWFKIGHVGILRGILSQEGMTEEQQSRIMQLLDKKLWEETLTVIRRSGASQNCLATLKKVFETKGKDSSQILKRIEENVQDYEKAVAAVGNLREILELTAESRVKLEVAIEAGFARGLEYYTGMIFEAYVPEIETALSGGGRYDKLIELFGGESTPALGVAQGIDRIVLAMEKQKIPPKTAKEKRVVVVSVSKESMAKAIELSSMLRGAGLSVEVEVTGRTVSKTLSDADRREVVHAIIVGPEELKEEKVVLRDMKKREQRVVNIKNLCEEILGNSK